MESLKKIATLNLQSSGKNCDLIEEFNARQKIIDTRRREAVCFFQKVVHALNALDNQDAPAAGTDPDDASPYEFKTDLCDHFETTKATSYECDRGINMDIRKQNDFRRLTVLLPESPNGVRSPVCTLYFSKETEAYTSSGLEKLIRNIPSTEGLAAQEAQSIIAGLQSKFTPS